MEINLTEIIGFAGAGLVVILGLFFAENIKNLAKHYFSNRSRGQINTMFYFVFFGGIVLFLGIAYLGGFEEKKNTTKVEEQTIPAKTPESEYIDAAKEIYDITTDAIKTKKHKDSIFIANKEKIWAYQIGTPKKRDAAWDLYEKVKDIDGVCFFKIARKEYLVIIHNGYGEDDITHAMTSTQAEIDSIGETLKIINMTTFCSKKEKVIEQKRLRNKRKNYEVRLYECEK